MRPLARCSPFVVYVDTLIGSCITALQAQDASEEKRRVLVDKLRNSPQFYSALAEVETHVFLHSHGLAIDIEPMAPQAGPDFRVRGETFGAFVEVRTLQNEEWEHKSDLVSAYVYQRMEKTPSKYFIDFDFDDSYQAYQPRLKRAVARAQHVLRDIEQKGIRKATLYYFDEGHFLVRPNGDLRLGEEEAVDRESLELYEKNHTCGFRVQYEALDVDKADNYTIISAGKARWIDPSGRLRKRLLEKLDQLPKHERNIVILDWSNCAMGEHDFLNALYGTLALTIRIGHPEEMTSRRRGDGFFLSTTRVQAVVGLNRHLAGETPQPRWVVFPTNNPNSSQRYSLEELGLFGDVPDDLRHLAAQ